MVFDGSRRPSVCRSVLLVFCEETRRFSGQTPFVAANGVMTQAPDFRRSGKRMGHTARRQDGILRTLWWPVSSTVVTTGMARIDV